MYFFEKIKMLKNQFKQDAILIYLKFINFINECLKNNSIVYNDIGNDHILARRTKYTLLLALLSLLIFKSLNIHRMTPNQVDFRLFLNPYTYRPSGHWFFF